MGLFKASFWSAVDTVFKLGCGFVIIKYLAIKTGPAGIAKFSQLQNFVTMVLMAVTGLFSTGVVKYVSEYCNDKKLQQVFIQAASFWASLGSIILAGIVAIFAHPLAKTFLKEPEYVHILYIFAIVLIFFSYNQLFLAVLNGRQKIQILILCRMCNSLIMLILTLILVYFFNLKGALIALVTVQAVVFPCTVYLVCKNNVCTLKEFIPDFHKKSMLNLSKYFLMSVVSAAIVPVSMIIIRNYIVQHLGWDQAGIWDAAKKIADLYIMVLTSAFSVYYLPVISKPLSKVSFQTEVRRIMIFGVSFALFSALVVYLLRDVVLWLLFTPKFKPMLTLLPIMLFGGVLKIAAWVYAYIMLAKSMTALYVISEIIFTAFMVSLSVLGICYFGLIGAAYTYVLMLACYLLFCYFFVYRRWIAKLQR